MHHMRNIRISSFLLVLAAVACEPPGDGFESASKLRELELTPELESAACPAWRQVARLHPQAPGCPQVSGWAGSPLFDDAPGELGDYCRYIWTGPGDADTSQLEAHPALVALAADCEVVFEQGGDAMWTAIGDDLEVLFHHAIGRATATDLDLTNTESSRSPVVVAVIDSIPEPVPETPRSEHGKLMASIVEDIACPDPLAACSVEAVNVLGLPRYGLGQKDLVHGGYYGSQVDIAQAIYSTVDAWLLQDWSEGTPKLIISLSLGWEGEVFGDTSAPVRPAVEAVHDAIEYAYCHDAIIVAAAGNEGYLCATEPLLPGGWEQLPAPDAARCAELGAPAPSLGGGYRPLVYSVGGLTHEYEPMPGTRANGMPRLAAAATHAVAGGDSTALTGTSVGSAVAAGTAALVWSYNPNFPPAAVMTGVYAGGTSLPLTADYAGPGVTGTTVHAINACGALAGVCSHPSSTCPAMPLACLGAPAPLTLDDLFAEIGALEPDFDEARSFVGPSPCAAECGGAAEGYRAEGLEGGSCPAPISPELPFTLPQPTQVGCPNCTLSLSSQEVLASIDPAYENDSIGEVVISVSDGVNTTYFSYGTLTLTVDQITRIQLDPALMPTNVVSADISIEFSSQPRPVIDDLLLR
jgi:hypothetical protein